MELTHGGDVAGFYLRHGRVPLDFSASLNPFGMPRSVEAAAVRAVREATPYPDPLCRRLRAGLAARLGVAAERLFFGNGAADVIFRLVQAVQPRRALVPTPSFEEYERALASVGCDIVFHALPEERGFAPDESVLSAITPDIDILFWCQPNNPTGHATEPDLLEAILCRCAETGTVLAVDECFCHFLPEPERYSLIRKIADNRHLFVIDSFTKLYGMAGIRLGYGVAGDEALVGRLERAGPPWAVSTIAQAAGLAALGEDEFVRVSLARIRAEKETLSRGLAEMGFRVVGSRANYLFFDSGIHDLRQRLEGEGILIRDCASFRNLRPGYCRVAVRLRDENERLLAALAAVANRR